MLTHHQKATGTALLLIILASLAIPVSYGLQSFSTVSTHGTISYLPHEDVTVNVNQAICINNLSLGFQIDFEWQTWLDRTGVRQLASEANFKVVRFHSTGIEPCTSWNEATKTGTFSWNTVDSLVQSIIDVGAEPMIDLGYAGTNGLTNPPPGMAINPSTGLPDPDSWAAYCREWVKHFKQTGKPVRFYEIINEPWTYFGWADYTRIGYFKALFNAAAQAMRNENPNILLGFDGSNRKPVLTYWLANGGADLDFISFHKYDSGTIGRYTDQEMFARAETFQLKTDSAYYGIKDAQLTYQNARGKLIPVINSESNLNSAYETGSDPKMQQMTGAVWTALVLRTEILEGLKQSVYYDYIASKSWNQMQPSGGCGFAMINKDDNQPYYPYYVNKLIGSNLAVGDQILESTCSSNDLRSLMWIHQGSTKLLLISKIDQPLRIALNGLSGEGNISFIDSTISWETPTLQTTTADLGNTINLQGYTVMLISL